APHDGGTVDLHIRHMSGGVFTDRVFSEAETALKIRDILRCEAPLGSFFLREDSDKPIVFVASGTGFAPIKAMIELMISKGMRRPPSSRPLPARTRTALAAGTPPPDLYTRGLGSAS